MISSIYGGALVTVQESLNYHSSIPVPSNAVPGTVWYDGQRMKVYTGTAWETVGSHVQLNGSPELQRTVDWARNKMAEEARDAELQEKFPALKQAKNNYDIIRKMVAE